MPNSMIPFPKNLDRLYGQEEILRSDAIRLIEAEPKLALQLDCIEYTMKLADTLRRFKTDNQDLKVIQLLGVRTLNSFGAGLKLALSGYRQNCALLMRDVIETAFLLDYFSKDRSLITCWKFANKRTRLRDF